MSKQTILILGAGANVGLATAKRFKTAGFAVAAVARNPLPELKETADLVLSADFNDPSCFAGIFETVAQRFGAPNVVVYNAYSSTPGKGEAGPVSAPVEDFTKDLTICTISAYAAAQQAVLGFQRLPKGIHKTFLYTGNRGNLVVFPAFMSLCLAKSATWYMIQSLAAHFKEQGFRFYFVDERTPEAKAMRYISGKGHAEMFLQLVEAEEQGPVLATFVKGKGYVAFPGEAERVLPVVDIAEASDMEYGKEGDE